MQKGKTIVYFDNSNIYKNLHYEGWRIDFEKLIQKLNIDQIWQVYFFTAVPDLERYKTTPFYKKLKYHLRWEIVALPVGQRSVHCKACGTSWTAQTEKCVDVSIAVTMLNHAINKSFETAVLVSGDKDFLELVKSIKRMGLRVEIASFKNSLSPDLGNESSAPVLFLDDLRSEIELTQPDYDPDIADRTAPPTIVQTSQE